MSYHNGSVWPHDNALIAQGLARYGRKGGINRIFDGLMRAATYMEHRRIPELYCGFRRRPGRGPTLYPAACSPQAWAAGAPFLMLQAMLGLEFDHEARRVVLVNPCLPASAGRIIVRNLTLGDANIDFAVSQDGEARLRAGVAHHRRSAGLSVVRWPRQGSGAKDALGSLSAEVRLLRRSLWDCVAQTSGRLHLLQADDTSRAAGRRRLGR